jgi:hypothetical protein
VFVRQLGAAAAAVVALGVCLGAAPASAETCPAPKGGTSVGEIDSGERIAYLRRAFDREIRDTERWSWAWTSVYVATVAGEGALYGSTHDRGKRIDDAVGIGSASFGAVALFALPLQLTLPLRSARVHLDGPDPCAALAEAEKTLEQVEKDQEFGHGIFGFLGNVAVNVGFGLLLGVGYDRWPSAALSTASGIIVGELNSLTQPHNLREVLERYRTGRFDLTSPRMTWAVVPVASAGAAGVGVRLSF